MSTHDFDIRLDPERGKMQIAAHASDVMIARDGDRVTILIGGLTAARETNAVIAPVVVCTADRCEPVERPDGPRLLHLASSPSTDPAP